MTPLQAVVLKAYAQLLPTTHLTRQSIEHALDTHPESKSAQHVAVTLAEHGGLMERGRLTEFGRQVAKKHILQLNTIQRRGIP